MDKFDLYKVDSKYINYLRQYDMNVADPKDFGHTRPYVGIMVYESSKYYWFAPLTSKINKSEFYCVKLYDIDKKPIASVRINNLIPICKSNTNLFKNLRYDELLNSKNEADRKYGSLLKFEVESMNEPSIKISIYTKAKKFLHEYSFNENIRRISNNFPLLEEKALEFSLDIFKDLNKEFKLEKKNKKAKELEEELVR